MGSEMDLLPKAIDSLKKILECKTRDVISSQTHLKHIYSCIIQVFFFETPFLEVEFTLTSNKLIYFERNTALKA